MSKYKFVPEDYELIVKGLDIALYIMEEAATNASNDLNEEDRKMAWEQVEKITAVRAKAKQCLESL